MYREALAMRRKLLGNEHPDVATTLNGLAWVLAVKGKLAEAETMYREALAMRGSSWATSIRMWHHRSMIWQMFFDAKASKPRLRNLSTSC